MSSEPGEVDPEAFSEATPADRATTADGGGGGGLSLPDLSMPDLSDVPVSKLKPLLKQRGDGIGTDEAKDRLPVGDGGAHMVDAVTRAAGVDDVPPVAQFCVGCMKAVRDRAKNAQ